jgi:hypothetical protein
MNSANGSLNCGGTGARVAPSSTMPLRVPKIAGVNIWEGARIRGRWAGALGGRERDTGRYINTDDKVTFHSRIYLCY